METLQPKTVDDVFMAFPANVIGKYLPVEKDIPKEFWSDNDWTPIIDDWFFKGLNKGVEFHPKDSVDAGKAFRHCRAVMKSYQPSHEHKIAGLAYLMSQFFEKITDWEHKDV